MKTIHKYCEEKASELSVEIAALKEKEDELTSQWMELSEQIESFT